MTHLALSGGLLGGFQEFIELKAGTPSSLAWWSLAPRLPDPDQPPPAGSDHDKLTILFGLLDEFLAVDHGGDHPPPAPLSRVGADGAAAAWV